MMAKSKGGVTVAKVWALCEPIVTGLGLTLWDVRYVKEGADRYLRIFIDKPDGVGISDCEAVSRAINDPLDALDPIESAYCLEVCRASSVSWCATSTLRGLSAPTSW